MNNIPEHLMAQAEDRVIQRRPRQVIPVIKMTVKEVMAMFDCPRETARDSVKRGYYIINYTKRTLIPGQLDPAEAYRMAWGCYHKLFRGHVPWWIEADDLVQEGVERLLQQAGHPRMNENTFVFRAAKYAMCEYLRKNRKHDNEDVSWIDFTADEERQHCAPSPDTWGAAHRATETMCRAIEAKGITPMEQAA